MIYALAHLLLAVALVAYALGRWRACAASAVTKSQPLVTISSENLNTNRKDHVAGRQAKRASKQIPRGLKARSE